MAKSMEANFADDAGERVGMSPQASAKTAAWLPDGMDFATDIGDEPAEAQTPASDADTQATPETGPETEALPSQAADGGVDADEDPRDSAGTDPSAGTDQNAGTGGLPDFLREHVQIVHVGADGESRSIDPVEVLLGDAAE